jgi:hypothetical protein
MTHMRRAVGVGDRRGDVIGLEWLHRESTLVGCTRGPRVDISCAREL